MAPGGKGSFFSREAAAASLEVAMMAQRASRGPGSEGSRAVSQAGFSLKGLEPEGDSTAAWRHLPVDTAGTPSGEASFFPGPARPLWGTAAELRLEPAPGLGTVPLAELVETRGAAGKVAVPAEVPGSLALVPRAAAGCKECGTVSQLAPGFLLEHELQTAESFLGQKHQLGRCNLSPQKTPQEGG